MNHNINELKLPKDNSMIDKLLKIEMWANQKEEKFISNLDLYRFILMRKHSAVKWIKTDNFESQKLIFNEIEYINDHIKHIVQL